MSIDREGFRDALSRPQLPDEIVEFKVSGFERSCELSTLLGFITLMLGNVSWESGAPWDNFLYNHHSIGKLEIPRFYDWNLRDAILPGFLEGGSGRKILGIKKLDFYITENERSYRQQPPGFHNENDDSIADTFYNIRLKLNIGDREVDFDIVRFYGDTRDKGDRDDGYVDVRHRGDIYDAAYLISVIPVEAWQAIWAAGKINYDFAGYRFQTRGDGVIVVSQDKRDNRNIDPVVKIVRYRVGASDVASGKINKKRG